MARESWTDERLDDLKGTVDNGFNDMREEFRGMREEFRAVRGEMNAQFLAQQRTAWLMFGGMFATFVVGFLGVIATILTQM